MKKVFISISAIAIFSMAMYFSVHTNDNSIVIENAKAFADGGDMGAVGCTPDEYWCAMDLDDDKQAAAGWLTHLPVVDVEG